MDTFLDIIGTVALLALGGLALCALGAIGIALWLFHTWDEAEKERRSKADV